MSSPKKYLADESKLSRFETLEHRRLLTAQWSNVIDNPYFPLLPGTQWVYKGSSGGQAEKVRVTVTNDTKVIDGATTTAVLDRVFRNGQLVERTYDYYAQDKAGNVWYFGENTSEYKNGKLINTDGSFEAGVNGAKAGIIMTAKPGVGDAYYQEMAKGVAEDQARVLSVKGKAKSPFASSSNCLVTKEFTALDPGAAEQKYYAPGIGLLYAKDVKGGDEVLRLASYELAPTGFGSVIDNPYFPLTPGTTYVFKGSLDGVAEKVRTVVTHDTKVVNGVTTTVVLDRVFVKGQVVERTYDYYAQDKIGNVWYFGEDTGEYVNGVLVNTDGSFLAGVNGAKAGFIMPAQPDTGLAYYEEHATGVAEDQARVIKNHQRVVTPFATFGDCLVTENFTALEPAALEHKFYAAGFGPVFSQDVRGGQDILRLVSVEFEQ